MDDRDEALGRLKETLRKQEEERAAAEARAQAAESRRTRLPLPRGRVLAWLIALLAVAVVVAPAVVLGENLADRFSVVNTVKGFCAGVEEANYNAACQLVSQRVRQQMTLSDFSQAVQPTLRKPAW